MKKDQIITSFLFGEIHTDLITQILGSLKKGWVPVRPPEQDLSDDYGDVLLIFDSDAAAQSGRIVRRYRSRLFGQVAALVLLPEGKTPPRRFDELVEYIRSPLSAGEAARAVQRLTSTIASKQEIRALQVKLTLQSQELSELNRIGIALSAERDPEALLELILTKAREITSADAGSLYLVETDPEKKEKETDFWGNKWLRFKLAHNDSLETSYKEFIMPVAKKSMAGYTAVTGEPLNIKDAYRIAADSEFQHNRSFDEKMGYRTQSVLCIPMKSHQGETIGVLQLINRKRDFDVRLEDKKARLRQVMPFDKRCEALASSLASQAAVSIENMRLYEEIKRLFEGFIIASVHAIEQRDPTTSGHSERVAELTVGLAETLNRHDRGPYADLRFSRDDIQQIKYASLLHDFGKIGVRERVLVKAKKLYPEQMESIRFRFRFIKQAIELNYTREQVRKLLNDQRSRSRPNLQDLDGDFKKRLEEIDRYLEFIVQANEPRVLEEGGVEKILEISQIQMDDFGNLLTGDETKLLTIPRGSLSEVERREIESHVTHTFNFLSRIPWASHLKAVPQIAYAHHEKLDGTGYPRSLKSSAIPIPSKMMTISDIYDALTAADRPYKKAMPSDRALSILDMEVKQGKIDPDLFEIFVQAKIFERVSRKETH